MLYLWAHPDGVPEPMDQLFFENLLRYLSDVTEKQARLSLLQIMLMQFVASFKCKEIDEIAHYTMD